MSKHKTASEDYLKAYNIVNTNKLHESEIVETSNKKAFRKYISELSKYVGNKFATRSINDNTLTVIRIE